VAVVIAILADTDALETRERAFEVSLAAESFLFDGALGFGGDVVIDVSDLDCFAELAIGGRDDGLGEVEAVLAEGGVAVALEAGVVEETVGVTLITEGEFVGNAAGEELC
jgi:hypothetical protein